MSVVCSHLSFSWPDDVELFSDLSFSVGPGRTGLVAPNGAGKSTLLKLIAGEYRPSAGTVTVDGAVGYLPQSLPFTADLTVAAVLGWPRCSTHWRRWPTVTPARTCSPPSAMTGTSKNGPAPSWTGSGFDGLALDRRLGTLSGGEVVSLGLAAQLLKRPAVLLLDEPTNNLDNGARHRLYDAIGQLHRMPAGGQSRPGTAGPDGSDRRAVPGRNRLLRRAISLPIRRPWRLRRWWPRATSATPNNSSSGRSDRCRRRVSGPPDARRPPRATSRTRGCPRSWRAS